MKIPPPLASTCTVTSCTSYQNPTASGKYIQSHILHVISKSHPLWQIHAKYCKVTSYTSYQNHNLSGKYMQSHILHVISKSHPLWQVHAKSHLTRHIIIPTPSDPLANTCKVTSYTSYLNATPSGKYVQSHILHMISKCPTPSGKYMQSHILHVILKSRPLWQVHAKSPLTRDIKIPPPLASTCKVTSYT